MEWLKLFADSLLHLHRQYWRKAPEIFLQFTHHLDYISCLLTVTSTALVGRRLWQGWLVAGVNSVIISLIGLRTGQWGFVPANLFCIAIYLYNIRQWRIPARPTHAAPESHRISALASTPKAIVHRRAS